MDNLVFERESRSMRRKVDTRSRGWQESDNSEWKCFGRGSCMMVEGFDRMKNGRCECSGYPRPFRGHCGSEVSLTFAEFANGDSPFRVVGGYC